MIKHRHRKHTTLPDDPCDISTSSSRTLNIYICTLTFFNLPGSNFSLEEICHLLLDRKLVLSTVSLSWHADPFSPSHGGGVVYLAHEEDAPRRVLQDEDQERSVEFQRLRQTHRHDFQSGGSCCLRSGFIHTEDGLVRHLETDQQGALSVLF